VLVDILVAVAGGGTTTLVGMLVSVTVGTVVPVGVLLAVALVSRGELAPVGR
jgi:hypothetical protein